MLLNYLKLSLRLMARNPFFTFISVVGLSVAFSAFIILWQYAQMELKSDRQWKDWQRIARLGFESEWSDNGQIWQKVKFGTNRPSIAPKVLDDYGELESITRIMYQNVFEDDITPVGNRIVITTQNTSGSKQNLIENRVACADANFFDFFSIPLLAGDPATVLQKVNAVVLNESQSIKMFGDESAFGKTILINDKLFEVTGVFQDLPRNTHMDFDIVLSNQSHLSTWAILGSPSCITYIKSKARIDWQAIENKMNQRDVIDRYHGEALKIIANDAKARNFLEPINEVPFSDARTTAKRSKSKEMMLSFQLIGLVVLLLAVINYIILTTAKLKGRLKELGTRKVSGAGRNDFFKQFFTETSLVFSVSIVLAFTLVQLLKSSMQLWLQIPSDSLTPNIIITLCIVVAVCIITCSVYPTYISQAFQPRSLFAKALPKQSERIISLPLFQYTVAVVLIIFCFMLYKQITFVLNQNLGFLKENVIVIDAPIIRTSNYESEIKTFVHNITAQGKVESATISTSVMSDPTSAHSMIGLQNSGSDVTIFFDTNGGVDENFIPFYNINLISGRNFLPDEKGNVIIVSEGALPRLSIANANNAVGSTIDVWDWYSGKLIETKIIGVVNGYRLRPFLKFGDEFDSPDRGIGLTYRSGVINQTAERISLRITADDSHQAMSSIQKEYEAMFPGNVFNWYFLDDTINRQYQNDRTWRNQVVFFASLAIGIACLGLLGMISNKVAEKTKEIGIRKVLGAELRQIVQLLLNTTFKQIIFSSLLGIPIAYYLTQQYLQNFSERMKMQWWHFTLPLVILVIIMFLTIASVLWKAAKSNPVEALKYE